jgi:DNA-directed RNA polymerase specialized sigma24 family protein
MATRQRGDLGSEGFERLLLALGTDREAAGHRYLELHGQLSDYFSWQGSEFPDELADETLNRLARKLDEGEAIQSPDRFAFGIARLVIREDRRSHATRQNALRKVREMNAGSGREPSGIGDLWECLAALERESRTLITSYYTEDDREALARRYGLSLNALRNRAMRIREKLFLCFTRRRDLS